MSPENFIEDGIVHAQNFVAETFGFQIFADESTIDCL